ncbi:MAG: Zinc carboxypeptidase [Verrucomicrobiales bacterium]|nr:Zinc carboxypeptidase [Verrucomicrobiales bacterium]
MPATNSVIQIDTNFPSGNIIVEKIEGDTITVHQDRRDTEGYWFYWCFRVRGAAGKTLTFNFTDGSPIGVRGPGVSIDEGASWTWLGKQPTMKSFIYSFPATAESVRFSFGMPYTEATLKTFLARIGSNRALKHETLCLSRKGRAVERLRVGKIKGEPKFRALVTCRAHCCEMMTSYVAEGLIEAVLAKDKEGEWFRNNVELLVIPFVDKDGVEDGDQGKNRRPRDHNRDYGTNSIYPETRAIKDFATQWSKGKLRFALDLHCPNVRGSVNETIYIVGSENPKTWQEQERFGAILEKVQNGPLVYKASNNLPFGTSWNAPANFTAGTSGSRWAAQVPGVKLGTTIEFPYANASDGEVNANTGRAFGHDLARAIRGYLEATP